METIDPYLAPAARLEPTREKRDFDTAGKGRRFLNYLIDSLATWPLGFGLGLAIALIGGEPAIAWLEQMSAFTEWVLGLGVTLAYYTLMEGAFGLTIGKLITNTRVVDEYGCKPSPRQALLRSLCRLIPFEAFSLLFSDDSDRRGWHDSLPRTYVIPRPPRGQPAGRPRYRAPAVLPGRPADAIAAAGP